MTENILNLDQMPDDAIERIVWLDGMKEQINSELEEAFAEGYFQARLEGRFEAALDLGIHGKRRALSYTRRINNRQARMTRWNDGLDRTSSGYKYRS